MLGGGLFTVPVVIEVFIAGIAGHLAVQCLQRSRRRSDARADVLLSALLSAMAALIFVNGLLFVDGVSESLMLVRTVLLAIAVFLLVPTVAAFGKRRASRLFLALLGTALAARTILFGATDLVFAHRLDAHGLPVYGPHLAVTSFPLVLVVLGALGLLRKNWSSSSESRLALDGIVVSTLTVAASLVATGALSELLTGAWIIPFLVSLQLIANRRSRERAVQAQHSRELQIQTNADLAREALRTKLALRSGGMEWFEFNRPTATFEVSPGLRRFLRPNPTEAAPPINVKDFAARIHAEDRVEGWSVLTGEQPGRVETQVRWHTLRGREMWAQLTAATTAEQPDRVVGMVRDITEKKRMDVELRVLAEHDPLTGFVNRRVIRACIDQQLAAGEEFTLLILDLDCFKDVNDSLGHLVGDNVLVEVANRFQQVMRPEDLLGRLGGDEFAVVVREKNTAAAATVARVLLSVLDRAIVVDGVAITVRASIGVASAPSDGTDFETLFRRADAAMYRAKRHGHTWRRYEGADESEAARRLHLAGLLPVAFAEGQLRVQYQPTLHVPTGRVRSAEALVRWHQPDLGLISPVEFVPLAEQYGLGTWLFQFVLHEALRQCAAWRAEGLLEKIAVNISPRSLLDPDLIPLVRAELLTAGVPPSALVLEITEDALVDQLDSALDVLRDLRSLGIELAIDDFGTGYSSLSYLKHLPVQHLKLDRSFICDIRANSADDEIVRFAIELAHNLGLSVVAEGVEDQATADWLAHRNCDIVQGYWLCRPDDANVITAWLRIRTRATARAVQPAR